MAKPLGADRFVRVLRAEGLVVHEVNGWRTHNRNHVGVFGPINGVMIHHTVTRGTASTVRLCYDGHSTLPGPLCHGVIDKAGEVWLVGHGRANHAGLGDDDVLRAVRNESYGSTPPATNERNVDGNAHFYGFECINMGDGIDPWPPAQLEAIEKVSAALVREYGWGEKSVIGHKEWSYTKVDPRGFSMSAMRRRIKARLEGQEDEVTPKDIEAVAEKVVDLLTGARRKDLADAIFRTDDVVRAPEGAGDYDKNPYWWVETYLRTGYVKTEELSAKLDGLVSGGVDTAAVAALVASHLDETLVAKIADELAARLRD